jgi:hypothetical protein
MGSRAGGNHATKIPGGDGFGRCTAHPDVTRAADPTRTEGTHIATSAINTERTRLLLLDPVKNRDRAIGFNSFHLAASRRLVEI